MRFIIKLSGTSIALLLLSLCLHAQSIEYMVRAGFNISSIEGSVTSSRTGTTMPLQQGFGFHAGALVDVPLSGFFNLQTGLMLQNVSSKAKEAGETLNLNLYYLQVPVLASFQVIFGDAVRLYINGGPYVAHGIAGRYTEEWRDQEWYNNSHYKRAFSSGSGRYGIDRFDFGLSMGTGLSYKQVYIGVNYDYGLTDIATGSKLSGSMHNRNVAITAGYIFQ